MMSGLYEYEPYKIRVSVSSSSPAVEEKVGFVRSLHMSVLKMELSGYPSYLYARYATQ
jgi:hypothetical protein